MSPHTFLIIGATGLQGRATLDALRSRGHHIRALTRRPDSSPARALSSMGVEVVAGNLDDKGSLDQALAGVAGAFLVTSFMGGGATVESEQRQGKNFVEAAAKARLPHLVFSSVAGAELRTGIPHFDSKWFIEEEARVLNVPLTVIRPVFFMENFRMPWLPRAMLVGGLQTVLGKDKVLQTIATVDIGMIAADFLDQGPASAGVVLEIAGDKGTIPQIQQTYSRITGYALRGIPMPRAILRRMPEEISRMLLWIGEYGFRADVDAVRRRYPALISFEAWLKKQTEGSR